MILTRWRSQNPCAKAMFCVRKLNLSDWILREKRLPVEAEERRADRKERAKIREEVRAERRADREASRALELQKFKIMMEALNSMNK